MMKRVKKFLSLLIILTTLLGSLGNTCSPCGGGKDPDPEPTDLSGEGCGTGDTTVSLDLFFNF